MPSPPLPRTLRRALLALLFLVPAASAQFVEGTVVDAKGLPVAGVDIDAFDLLAGGVEVPLSGDVTDIHGAFLTTLPAAGLYEFSFTAPVPKKLLPRTLSNVAVAVTTDLGDVALEQGATLSGRLVSPGLAPVGNVSVDVVDALTGLDAALLSTNAQGIFSVLLPIGVYEVEIDPDGSDFLGTLAPEAFTVELATSKNVGSLVMRDGYVLSTRVVSAAGTPVQGVDLDVTDRFTGDDLFTPNDNSGPTGVLSVVVPAGRYDLELCPLPGSGLVTLGVTGLHVSSDLAFGDITISAGMPLGGLVLDMFGDAVPGADLDLLDPVTGNEIALCRDDANASGVYSVFVPLGTYDAVFSAPGNSLLGQVVMPGVVVSGPTILNAVLTPDLANATPGGPAKPAGGAPGSAPGSMGAGAGGGAQPTQGTGPLAPSAKLD